MRVRKIFVLLLFLTILAGGGFLFLYLKRPSLCRTQLGAPLETGIIGDADGFFGEYQSLISTLACIVSIEEGSDTLFPDSSARIKIGYFDNSGKLVVYPARLGGEDFDGNQIGVSLCVYGGEGSLVNCKFASPAETLQNLEKGKIVGMDIVLDDGAPWEASEQLRKYRGTMTQLKTSLQSGDYFPIISDEDFVIQIMQITLLQ